MEKNIIKALVKADKHLQDQIKKVEDNYTTFLSSIQAYKTKEEESFVHQFNQDKQLYQDELESKFNVFKEKIDQTHQHQNVIFKEDDIVSFVATLFDEVTKGS